MSMFNKADLVELLSWRYNFNFGRTSTDKLHFEVLEPIELGRIYYMNKAQFYSSHYYPKLVRLSGGRNRTLVN
mgnify:CR=1 FL=1